MLEGLRGVDSLYYRWSKEFLDAGKKRLAGDGALEATSGDVRNQETTAPKEAVADFTLETRLL